MKTLIIFATYSGGTQAAATIVSNVCKKNGHTVSIETPKQIKEEDIASSDLTVLCSPSWDLNGKDGQPHEDFFVLIEKTKNSKFNGKQFAILGLGDTSYPHFCGAVNILEKYVTEKNGVLKSPSLKIDGFYFDEINHTKTIEKWSQTLI